mgnify:CR=1 FL=1
MVFLLARRLGLMCYKKDAREDQKRGEQLDQVDAVAPHHQSIAGCNHRLQIDEDAKCSGQQFSNGKQVQQIGEKRGEHNYETYSQ